MTSKRGRKRTKRNTFRLSQIEESGIEESLERIASKTNLTALNVKSILHYVLKDRRVLRMALSAATAANATERNDGAEDEESEKDDDEADDEEDEDVEEGPSSSFTLTRSRLRQATPSKPASPAKTFSDVKQSNNLFDFMNAPLSDLSSSSASDCEFQPGEEESFISDGSDAGSDVATAPSTAATDATQGPQSLSREEEEEEEEEEKDSANFLDSFLNSPTPSLTWPSGDHTYAQNCVSGFVPLAGGDDEAKDPVTSDNDACIPSIDRSREDLIARRTRSRYSLANTLLEQIEADFQAPDAGPDLYHTVENPGKDDLAWREWLGDLMKTDFLCEERTAGGGGGDGGGGAVSVTVADEEEDPEYTVALDEICEEDEEYRNDRPVLISSKEVSDLLEEFIENCATKGFLPSLLDDFSTLLIKEGETGVEGSNLFNNQQLITLKNQLRQHLQLTCQGYLLSVQDSTLNEYTVTWKEQVKELHKRSQQGGDESIFKLPGIEDAKALVTEDQEKISGEQFVCGSGRRSVTLPMRAVDYLATALLDRSELFAYWDLLPSVGFASVSSGPLSDSIRPSFTQAEDNLMAIGLERFSKKWDLVSKRFLPTKTEKQLKIRFKNLCSARFAENSVKEWKTTGKVSLTNTCYSATELDVDLSTASVARMFNGPAPEWFVTYSQLKEIESGAIPPDFGKRRIDRDELRRIAPASVPITAAAAGSIHKFVLCSDGPGMPLLHVVKSTPKGLDFSGKKAAVSLSSPCVSPLRNSDPNAGVAASVHTSPATAGSTTSVSSPVVAVGSSAVTTTTTTTATTLSAVRTTALSSTQPAGARKPHLTNRAMVQSILSKPDPKANERSEQYACWYFKQVKKTLQDYPDKYRDFVAVMEAYNSGKKTIRELYRDISELFENWPDLVRRFAGFLRPEDGLFAEAFEDVMDFHQAYNFLRKLEAYFRKHPASHLQKICQVLADFSPTENNAVEIRAKVVPLLKGHKELIDDFNDFFDEKAFIKKCSGPFEIIHMNSGTEDEVDEFEEIRFSSSFDDNDAGESGRKRLKPYRRKCPLCGKPSRAAAATAAVAAGRPVLGKQRQTSKLYCSCRGTKKRRPPVALPRRRQPVAVAAAVPAAVPAASAAVLTSSQSRQQPKIVEQQTTTKTPVEDVPSARAVETLVPRDEGEADAEDNGEEEEEEEEETSDEEEERVQIMNSSDECVVLTEEDEEDVEERENVQRNLASADNRVVDQDGSVVVWGRDDDRMVLSVCREKGMNASAYEFLASKLENKTIAQIEARMEKLMELFNKTAQQQTVPKTEEEEDEEEDVFCTTQSSPDSCCSSIEVLSLSDDE